MVMDIDQMSRRGRPFVRIRTSVDSPALPYR